MEKNKLTAPDDCLFWFSKDFCSLRRLDAFLLS